MKKAIIVLLVVLSLAGLAFAETLQTANTVGQGKWAILGAYINDANPLNFNEGAAATIGGYAEYGITSKLDLLLSAGSTDFFAGLPAGMSVDTVSFGIDGKYALVEETANMPAVAALLGYKMLNLQTNTGGYFPSDTGAQIIVGVGVSKVMSIFAPYASVDYRSTSWSNVTDMNGTQLDATIGSAIAWSKQGAVFAEATMQMMTPSKGDAYTSNQVAVGVGYKL